MHYKVSIIIEKDEDGYYAYCPDISGCQSQGDSLEEITENIQEAVELYVETLSPEEKHETSPKIKGTLATNLVETRNFASLHSLKGDVYYIQR